MDIRTQSALLSAIVGVALGLSMLLRRARPRVISLYGILALNVGGYYAASFLHSLVVPGASVQWPERMTLGAVLALASLVPASTIAFFLEFLGIPSARVRRMRWWATLTAALGFLVAVTPLAESEVVQATVVIWVLCALLVALTLLLGRVRQTSSPVDRQRLTYVAIGGAAAVLFSALDFLPVFNVPWPHLGPIFTTLYLFFLAQTLLRSRLLDLNELLGKVAAQTALAAVVGAVFALLTAWVGDNRGLYLFNTTVAAFVIITLLEPLRGVIEDRVFAIFFRERQALLQSLRELITRMANVIEVPALSTLVLDALNETRRITHASIYLLAEDRPGFRLHAFRGPQPTELLDAAAARSVLEAASQGQRAILLENLGRRAVEVRAHLEDGKRTRETLRKLHDIRSALDQMKAGICVPLMGRDGAVMGFFNLWDERFAESYGTDEISALLEVGEGIAQVVENSRLYEQMRERDRLAALGEMAAGLAHEIRNPLGAIKGAAQCLDPKSTSKEDAEFLEVIVEEVNRLNGVVTAFLDYARPMKQHFAPIDVNEVVSRSARLIQNDLPSNVSLRLELAMGLRRVEGDPEHLKQVLLNLVQNASQAMGQRKGIVTVTTRHPLRVEDLRGVHDGVELIVADNGPGIPSEQQQHLFVPFYTTKEKGTGLGLAICQRIIRNHGGTISAKSRAGEGTSFVIRLPSIVPQEAVDAALGEGPPQPPPVQKPIKGRRDKRGKRARA